MQSNVFYYKVYLKKSTKANLLYMVVCGSSLIQFGFSDQITQRLSMSIWVTPVLEACKSYDPAGDKIL